MLSCFSCVELFATLWTVARQAPRSMKFSRQEWWNGLLCPPPGDLPYPGIEPVSSALASGLLTSRAIWEAHSISIGESIFSRIPWFSPLSSLYPLVHTWETGSHRYPLLNLTIQLLKYHQFVSSPICFSSCI